MKRIFIPLLSVVSIGAFYASGLLLAVQSNVAAASPEVWMYVTPSSSSMEAGYTRNMQVRLGKDSNSKVDYAEARIHFSTAHLEIVSVSKRSSHFSYGGGPSVSYSNSSGTAVISGTGALLPTQSDALIATISFRAKSAGKAVISLDSDSRAGDKVGGSNNVKNVLDGRDGATVTVSSSASGDLGSSPPPVADPEPDSDPDPEPDKPTSDNPTSDDETSDSDTSSGVTAGSDLDSFGTAQEAASERPLWQRYMIPGLAGLVALGSVGVGVFLYARRNRQAVKLPPIDHSQPEETAMPSTEQLAAEPVDIETFPNTQPDNLSDTSVEPVPVTGIAPLSDEPSYQPVEPVAAMPIVAIQDEPAYAEPPQLAVAQAPVAPVSPQNEQADRQFAPPASPAPAQPVQFDYANMPDMFDLGAERLRSEGHDDLLAGKPPQSPVA